MTGTASPTTKMSNEELSASFESLETMRKLNLEVACQERGIPIQLIGDEASMRGKQRFDRCCSTCLLSSSVRKEHCNEQATTGGQTEDVESNDDDKDPQDDDESDGDENQTHTAERTTSANVSSNKKESTPLSHWFGLFNNMIQEKGSLGEKTVKKKANDEKTTTTTSIIDIVVNHGIPCFLCGHPACKAHSSETFSEHNIAVCLECEKLFTADFITEFLSASASGDETSGAHDEATSSSLPSSSNDWKKHDKKYAFRRAQLDRMVDLYDRTMLLLTYSSQCHIDYIARRLEEMDAHEHRMSVEFGTSAAILGGAFGIASAALGLFTPAAAPLLITSLLFGGSATAVQTASHVHICRSTPNLLADRLLALHGMLKSILRVTCTLDVLLRCYTNIAAGSCSSAVDDEANIDDDMSGPVLKRLDWDKFCAQLGERNSAMRVLANNVNMATTLQTKFQMGNPRTKAYLLRQMQEELSAGIFPSTQELDADCDAFLETFTQYERAAAVEEAARAILLCRRLVQEQSMIASNAIEATEEDSETYDDDALFGDDCDARDENCGNDISESSVDWDYDGFCTQETRDAKSMAQLPSHDTASAGFPVSNARNHPAPSLSTSKKHSSRLLERIERFKQEAAEPNEFTTKAKTRSIGGSNSKTNRKNMSLLERISLHKQQQKQQPPQQKQFEKGAIHFQ